MDCPFSDAKTAVGSSRTPAMDTLRDRQVLVEMVEQGDPNIRVLAGTDLLHDTPFVGSPRCKLIVAERQ